MQAAQICLENVSLHQFWFISNNFPDLVSRLLVQIRPMGNCGLNGRTLWLSNTDGVYCSFCKESIEDVLLFLQGEYRRCHSFFLCLFRIQDNLNQKIMSSNSIDTGHIANFIDSLDTGGPVIINRNQFDN